MAKKKILFACIGNCCRSQMAEGFAKKLAGDKFEIYSAGTKPAGFVHPDAIAVMKELGIDISPHYSKGFDQVPAKEFDYVVTMGCSKTCPVVPTKEKIDWEIEDPIGQPIEVFRRVRDDIKAKIEEFLSSL
ncbi:MAG: arsenate reductase ArsC [Candidatus Margulisiibacteriota bacterium]